MTTSPVTPLAIRSIGDRVVSIITWRLVPFLFLLYIIAYLDRINVGFAALQMQDQLGFTNDIYGNGAGAFFLGYFFFQVPQQSDIAEGRGQALDLHPDDDLGCDLLLHDVCPHSLGLLWNALFTGAGGSGIFSRGHLLSQKLVSGRCARTHSGLVHDGRYTFSSGWRADIRCIVESPRP